MIFLFESCVDQFLCLCMRKNVEKSILFTYFHFIYLQYSDAFNLSSLTSSGQWIKLWTSSFEYLKTTTTMQMECLQTIRILSRDKTYLNETINDDQFDCLLDIGKYF